LDCASETDRICKNMQQLLARRFRKRGLVVALSGGIDSSVVAALAVRAVGKERVFGIQMPEKDSSEDTLYLSGLIGKKYGFEVVHRDITEVLTAVGCYQQRDDAIRQVIPEYADGWKCKILLPSILEDESYRVYSVAVMSPDGEMRTERLTTAGYLGILAATNFKQRVRKMMEYYYADRLNYAVTGTPNRLEYDQGFFVKLGDGAADIKPIAHLYKSQVYQMAAYLEVPDEIRNRPPTTDTYSMPQSQEEFYFSLPYDKMDLCLYGRNHGLPAEVVAPVVGLTAEQVGRVYADIDGKRKSTDYLHTPPVLMGDVPEIGH
jgi:NAD+ synthase